MDQYSSIVLICNINKMIAIKLHSITLRESDAYTLVLEKIRSRKKCIGNHIVLVILPGVIPYSVGYIAWCHSI